ncbi:hypothetical protein NQ315_010684 [Exocentrus adspersus]|uniref:Uncharacterized protein n=1 Tax=Exocentrus adspersus TaxID=1586481 RepID=A0AAV8VU74_9CUCU|nr:hypothetical protein NQ315_010684 [Exocentrus adspersus]
MDGASCADALVLCILHESFYDVFTEVSNLLKERYPPILTTNICDLGMGILSFLNLMEAWNRTTTLLLFKHTVQIFSPCVEAELFQLAMQIGDHIKCRIGTIRWFVVYPNGISISSFTKRVHHVEII